MLRYIMMTLVLGYSLWAVPLQAQETAEQKYIVNAELIANGAKHSAFTDIIRYRGDLYCTFREGSGHIPGRNGLIRVLISKDDQNWESFALIDEQHVDLRDPKICITPDDRLMINCGASYYEGSKRLKIESRVSFLDNQTGKFSAPTKVILPEPYVTGSDWLWRITWYADWAYGAVQQVSPGEPRKLQLVRSRDAVTWEHVAEMMVPFPSETTLRFQEDGTMLALSRREGGGYMGWLGKSKAPYTKWDFEETNKRLGGPDFVALPGGKWIAGSRDYIGKATTQLWWLDVKTGQFSDLLNLPSGGDTSYPGFYVDEKANRVFVSYYSSHEGRTSIYLTSLRLDALEE